MAGLRFIGSFTSQESIVEVKITGALALMPLGRRLRLYETGPDEVTATLGQTLQLLWAAAAPLGEFLLAETDRPDLAGAA